MTLDEAINLARQHHQAGRLAQAEAIYRQVLVQQPNHPNAIHLLGVLASQSGQYETAMDLIGKAIALNPNEADYHSNLGAILAARGCIEESAACYRRALALNPGSIEANFNLGTALCSLGRLDEAIPVLQRALILRPAAGGFLSLGYALSLQERFDEAIAAYRQAIQLRPDYPEAQNDLGLALFRQGQDDAAIALFRQVLALHPDSQPAIFNLTNALAADGKFDQAMAEYRQAQSLASSLLETQARPDTAGKVFAVCSVRNGGTELLPHWLEHYSRLGVDHLLLGVFDDVSSTVRSEINRCADRWRFTCFKQTWTGVHEALMGEQRRQGCRRAGAGPGSWIIHTDLDELQEYPAPLTEIIAACNDQGITAVIGWMLNRVAEDGSLPPIRPSPSLGEQFPVGCRLTAKVLRTVTQKIMLARSDVLVQTGHHTVAPTDKFGMVPLGRADQYIVHHFKWHADLLSRLQWSLSQPNTQREWKIDARRFMAWLKANNGRINLLDPQLQARRMVAV